MGKERREIHERLEALERLAQSRHEDRGSRDHDRHRSRGRDGCDRRHDHEHHSDRYDRDGGDFDEKRIIDTIVRLVTENVGSLLDERQLSTQSNEGGGEKRFVDLIVGLVSEHVKEIVASELDRRFGRPALAPAGTEPPPTTPASAPPARGGSSEPERS